MPPQSSIMPWSSEEFKEKAIVFLAVEKSCVCRICKLCSINNLSFFLLVLDFLNMFLNWDIYRFLKTSTLAQCMLCRKLGWLLLPYTGIRASGQWMTFIFPVKLYLTWQLKINETRDCLHLKSWSESTESMSKGQRFHDDFISVSTLYSVGKHLSAGRGR